jgi:hypothetical protein
MIQLKWLILIFLGSQLFLYAARVPMHRALRNIANTLGGGFRLASRWCRGMASELRERSRELALEAGRESSERKVEQEFHRLQNSFSRDLAELPRLQRKIDDLVTKLDTDYEECRQSPPAAPGWADAVKALAQVPSQTDMTVAKALEEFHKSAMTSEKSALDEYRKATSKRHKILDGMRPALTDLKRSSESAAKSCKEALAVTGRIDGYIDDYESARKGDSAAGRVHAWSAVNAFVISAVVLAIALGGAFINFQLIALPMSELVPANTRLLGMSVPSIAALVIVLMEVATGMFVMEMLGITNLFPQMSALPASRRRLVLGVSFFGLLLLAGIESSLAIMREHLVSAETALKESLAGNAAGAAAAAEAGARTLESRIPMIGQAVLGFILPFILAMVAVPLEVMVRNGGPVGLLTVSIGADGTSYIMRAVGSALRYAALAVRALYDVYIAIPLLFERLVHGKRNASGEHSRGRDRSKRHDSSTGGGRSGGGGRGAHPGVAPASRTANTGGVPLTSRAAGSSATAAGSSAKAAVSPAKADVSPAKAAGSQAKAADAQPRFRQPRKAEVRK